MQLENTFKTNRFLHIFDFKGSQPFSEPPKSQIHSPDSRIHSPDSKIQKIFANFSPIRPKTMVPSYLATKNPRSRIQNSENIFKYSHLFISVHPFPLFRKYFQIFTSIHFCPSLPLFISVHPCARTPDRR